MTFKAKILKCFLISTFFINVQEGRSQIMHENTDSLNNEMSYIQEDSNKTDTTKNVRKDNFIKKIIREFNAIDTNYIIPNKYNWTVMMQNTNSFERYKLHSRENNQQLVFSPKPGIKIGPYLGWRWIFLGYTFDTSSFGNTKSQKTEFELSFYTSMFGCDLIYRRTGEDFKLRKITGFGDADKDVEGKMYKGINVNVTGINAYYIFNHKRFSYPAAFAQSTVQKKSCGTWKLGLSCTKHELNFDYNSLPPELIYDDEHEISDDFKFNILEYTDVSVSVGYAYNWVFKPGFLLCASVTPAIGYKATHIKPTTDADYKPEQSELLMPMHLDDFNFDVTGRLGLVWNNTKYYAGLSLIVHNYNYRHKKLSISNTFGTLNFYVGFNFNKRKEYRDDK